MIPGNHDPARPIVSLDYVVDSMRYDGVREQFDRHLRKRGVESVTLNISARSGDPSIACDMHEYLSELEGDSRILIRTVLSGRCCASAILVALAAKLEHRRCTDTATLVLRQPFLTPGKLSVYGSDEAVSKAIRSAQHGAERFFGLFGAAIAKSAVETIDLFGHDDRSAEKCAERAQQLGIVSEIITYRELRAA